MLGTFCIVHGVGPSRTGALACLPLFASTSKLNSEMGREDRVSDPGVVDAANRPDFC